jgi:hypothetical protein
MPYGGIGWLAHWSAKVRIGLRYGAQLSSRNAGLTKAAAWLTAVAVAPPPVMSARISFSVRCRCAEARSFQKLASVYALAPLTMVAPARAWFNV